MHPLGFAVLRRQVGLRQDGDDPRAGRQRRVHPLHEIAVGEIPILQNNSLARPFEDLTHTPRKIRIQPRAADEEIRQLFFNPVHAALVVILLIIHPSRARRDRKAAYV